MSPTSPSKPKRMGLTWCWLGTPTAGRYVCRCLGPRTRCGWTLASPSPQGFRSSRRGCCISRRGWGTPFRCGLDVRPRWSGWTAARKQPPWPEPPPSALSRPAEPPAERPEPRLAVGGGLDQRHEEVLQRLVRGDQRVQAVASAHHGFADAGCRPGAVYGQDDGGVLHARDVTKRAEHLQKGLVNS